LDPVTLGNLVLIGFGQWDQVGNDSWSRVTNEVFTVGASTMLVAVNRFF
jgi:hypothetical protein